jgi:hypothetical protein
MSLQPSRERLMTDTKELSIAWGQTQSCWRDAKRDEFERLYIAELVSAVDDAIRAITEIDELLTKIRHDCE